MNILIKKNIAKVLAPQCFSNTLTMLTIPTGPGWMICPLQIKKKSLRFLSINI